MSEFIERCIVCKRAYDAGLDECPHCKFTVDNADILREDAEERARIAAEDKED